MQGEMSKNIETIGNVWVCWECMGMYGAVWNCIVNYCEASTKNRLEPIKIPWFCAGEPSGTNQGAGSYKLHGSAKVLPMIGKNDPQHLRTHKTI